MHLAICIHANPQSACESAIPEVGGIDIQILGIGHSGHIGFNEPGSATNTRTHRTHLDAAEALG